MGQGLCQVQTIRVHAEPRISQAVLNNIQKDQVADETDAEGDAVRQEVEARFALGRLVGHNGFSHWLLFNRFQS